MRSIHTILVIIIVILAFLFSTQSLPHLRTAFNLKMATYQILLRFLIR